MAKEMTTEEELIDVLVDMSNHLANIGQQLEVINECGISIVDNNGDSESNPLHIRGYYDEYMAKALHRMSETMDVIKDRI